MGFVPPFVIILLRKQSWMEVLQNMLAHKLKDKSVAAYQRGAMMDKRRLMMQRYANYAYQTGEKVVQLRTSI
jgi:hypothetical protein